MTTTHKTIHTVPATYLVAAVLQSDTILGHLQRELYRALPGITVEQLREMLQTEILRSDVVTGDIAQEAQSLQRRMEELRRKGLTMTQTLEVVTGQRSAAIDEDDVYHILREDKRYAGDGG
ncbi:MAG TPA: hypothetical protein VMT34_12090 [Aggregatilineales bacterium]|nr:hypothetical protein [Aggregatilineales bacterium]